MILNISRRAIAPVSKRIPLPKAIMLTTGAIAHRLSCADAELYELSGEIMEMLQEVHS